MALESDCKDTHKHHSCAVRRPQSGCCRNGRWPHGRGRLPARHAVWRPAVQAAELGLLPTRSGIAVPPRHGRDCTHSSAQPAVPAARFWRHIPAPHRRGQALPRHAPGYDCLGRDSPLPPRMRNPADADVSGSLPPAVRRARRSGRAGRPVPRGCRRPRPHRRRARGCGRPCARSRSGARSGSPSCRG